jgi:hypothetical protein
VTTNFGGFSVFFTFSIVFRLKQPLHVEGKMKKLNIIQCMFNKKFFWACKAFIKIQTFKKGVILWCLWVECNEKVYKGQNYFDYKLKHLIMESIVTYG